MEGMPKDRPEREAVLSDVAYAALFGRIIAVAIEDRDEVLVNVNTFADEAATLEAWSLLLDSFGETAVELVA